MLLVSFYFEMKFYYDTNIIKWNEAFIIRRFRITISDLDTFSVLLIKINLKIEITTFAFEMK